MEISRETLLGMYRKMLTIRRFEERAAELMRRGGCRDSFTSMWAKKLWRRESAPL